MKPKKTPNRKEDPRVILRPFNSKSRPNEKWVVYWPAETPGKPRKYKRFKTEGEAKKFQKDKETSLTNYGRKIAGLRDQAMKEAEWALAQLAPYGVSLREVVSEYVERRKWAEKSERVSDAVPDFLESKEKAGRSKRYIGDLSAKLNRFADTFGERPLSEIASPDLDAWLEGLGVAPVTRNGFRRVLVVFFEWGRKKGYCGENPAKLAETATVKRKAVPIFTPGELRVILDHAPANLVPVLALGAFAGLRPEEIRRLDWRQVNFLRERIEIDAETSKTAEHRYVPLNPTLKEWLQPIAKAAGPVAPPNLYRRLWNFHKTLAEKDEEKGRPAVEWKHNALRHSFASYSLAQEEDAARVALWLGHASPTMTFQHYRERVEAEAATEWFSVSPKKKRIEAMKKELEAAEKEAAEKRAKREAKKKAA